MPIVKLRFPSRRLIALFSFCIFLSGCATMFAPSHDTISIQTDPEGAQVYDGANLLGTTPLKYSFKREAFDQKVLTIRMKGRKSQDLPLGRTLDKTSLLNFGYFLTTAGGTCWLIDSSSGNMIKYSPDSYLIELEREGRSGDAKQQGYLQRLRFVVTNQADLSLDIARGDGNYLRAYFSMRAAARSVTDYSRFLSAVSRQARYLLGSDDPLDLFHELEKSAA